MVVDRFLFIFCCLFVYLFVLYVGVCWCALFCCVLCALYVWLCLVVASSCACRVRVCMRYVGFASEPYVRTAAGIFWIRVLVRPFVNVRGTGVRAGGSA